MVLGSFATYVSVPNEEMKEDEKLKPYETSKTLPWHRIATHGQHKTEIHVEGIPKTFTLLRSKNKKVQLESCYFGTKRLELDSKVENGYLTITRSNFLHTDWF